MSAGGPSNAVRDERARVVIQGFGAMGQACLGMLETRRDAEVTAVLDVDPSVVGRTLGELSPGTRWPQVIVESPSAEAVAGADVAVHATTAFAADAVPQIERLLGAGLDVVTICQELVHPVEERVVVAAALDAAARRAGRSVIAAGINPGLVLDVIPIAAAMGSVDIRAVTCRRVVDFSPYGVDEMAHIGAGLREDEFIALAEAGSVGHIGLRESAAMVASALDLDVGSWEQTKQPIIGRREHRTAFVTTEAGRVRGFTQRVTGHDGTATVIDIEMVGLLDPDDEDPPLGDSIQIDATPGVDMFIRSQFAQRGGLGTAAVATNLIGPALAARPGLIPVWELPLVRSRRQLRVPAAGAPGG